MSDQENNNSFKLNIGGPSIILLLTVLGLAVFSILAVRAAYSGLQMARTSAKAVAAYYEAEGKAQATEFAIREAAASGALLNGDVLLYGGNIVLEPGFVSYEIPINDRSVIHVELHGNEDFSDLIVMDHRLIVETEGEYSGSAFEIDPIEFY